MAAARSSPAAVSGISVRPVCAPERLHSVSPWRISQRFPGVFMWGRAEIAGFDLTLAFFSTGLQSRTKARLEVRAPAGRD
jgi:hypothetical protein